MGRVLRASPPPTGCLLRDWFLEVPQQGHSGAKAGKGRALQNQPKSEANPQGGWGVSLGEDGGVMDETLDQGYREPGL